MAGENNTHKKTTGSGTSSSKKTTEVIKNPYKKTEKAYVNNRPAQNRPAQNKPAQNKPAQNKPAQNRPAQNKPAQNKPAQNKPAQNKPAQNRPAQNRPAQNRPAQNKPAQNRPAQNKPAQNKPAQNKPAQNRPAQNKPAQNKPAQNKPTQNKPAQNINHQNQSSYRNSGQVRSTEGNFNTRNAIITGILALLAGIIVIYFVISLCDPIVYSEFYSSAEKLAEIPGMTEGFVPQGLAYSDDADIHLICGYMDGDAASRIYIITPDGQSKELRLKDENGEIFTGHAGGISCNGNHVYISNGGKIFYISLTTLLDAKDLQSVRFEGSFEVPCRASFTFCSEDMLYVGEFYHTGYEVDESHYVDLGNGDKNHAFVMGYKLDSNSKFGVGNINNPDVIYSVRDKVQGFAVTGDGNVVLSCSYGVSDSYLYIYDKPKSTTMSFTVNEVDVPVYVLNDSCLKDDIKMPLMSEDIDVVNGGIIIGFESYSLKYGGGMLPFSINNIMKYTIDD